MLKCVYKGILASAAGVALELEVYRGSGLLDHVIQGGSSKAMMKPEVLAIQFLS